MIDFRALAAEYGIPVIDSGHHHCHEGWLQTHCPFCSGGTSGWHLGFSLERGNFNCWRCGTHQTLEVLAQLLHGEQTARSAMGRYYSQEVSSPPPKAKTRRKTLWTPPSLEPMKKAHREYLRRRRFDPDKLEEEWGLSGTRHLSGLWNWRVVFPIEDRQGRRVAFGGRSIRDETKPKYRLSSNEQMDCDPHELLYGIDRVEGDSVVIVEGPADVWRLGPGAVATLGIDWKTQQALQLKRFPNRAIMFDPSPDAQRRATALAEWLGMFKGWTEVIDGLPCDPGDLDQEKADQIMRELTHD